MTKNTVHASSVAKSDQTSSEESETTVLNWLALAVMLSGTFLFVLDFFIVNVALPSIQTELLASPSLLLWVVAGYGVANAALLILGGRLGDIFGQRRVFAWGTGSFAVASLLCGLAPSPELLVAARVMQGAAGALMQPQVLAMLNLTYRGSKRTQAFAWYGLVLGGAAVLGQVIGGILIELDLFGLGWRACFLINVPIGVLSLFLIPRVLPAFPGQTRKNLDGLSVVLVGLSMSALLIGLIQGQANNWPVWTGASIAVSLPILVWLVKKQSLLEAKGMIALLPSSLFGNSRFLMGIAAALAFYMANAAFYFVLALHLQNTMNLSPLKSGMVFAVMAAGFFAATLSSPKLQACLKGKSVLFGAVILTIAHLSQSVVVSGYFFQVTNLWAVACVLFVQGIGIGMVMAPLAANILLSVRSDETGAASGLLGTINQMGNALGVALVGIVFFGIAGDMAANDAMSSAFSWSLIYLSVMTTLTAVFIWISQRAKFVR